MSPKSHKASSASSCPSSASVPSSSQSVLHKKIFTCTALSFGAGAVFGWTFGQEVANHWLQLYRLDTMAAQVKFMEWWQNKVEEQS